MGTWKRFDKSEFGDLITMGVAHILIRALGAHIHPQRMWWISYRRYFTSRRDISHLAEVFHSLRRSAKREFTDPYKAKQKPWNPNLEFHGFCSCDRDCKPGSVIDSHLSRHTVADMLKPPPGDGRANQCLHHGVAPNRVYSITMFPCDG